MKVKSRLEKRSPEKLSLNANREDAFWQYERGPRYGNARKARAKAKKQLRRKERKNYKIENYE